MCLQDPDKISHAGSIAAVAKSPSRISLICLLAASPDTLNEGGDQHHRFVLQLTYADAFQQRPNLKSVPMNFRNSVVREFGFRHGVFAPVFEMEQRGSGCLISSWNTRASSMRCCKQPTQLAGSGSCVWLPAERNRGSRFRDRWRLRAPNTPSKRF
jgi:hypothetical protein